MRGTNAIHPLMRLSLIPFFSPWHLLLPEEHHFFQKNCLEDTIVPEVKRIILAKIQYVNKCNTSLMKLRLTIIFLHKICFKRKNRLLQNYVCFVLLFHSYARAYCIHATMSLPKSTIYTLLFHNNDSLYCCIFFQSIGSQPYQGIYRKLCTYWHQHVL